MAVRKDEIQISVDIEANQGVKNYQKLLDEAKSVNNEMRKMKRQGKENTDEFKKLERQSKKLGQEMSKLGGKGANMGQLLTRSRQLNQELKRLVPGTKKFIAATKELQTVNSRLKDIRETVKGVGKGMEKTRILGVSLPTGMAKAFVASQVLQFLGKMFNILDQTTKQFVKLRGQIEQTTNASGNQLDEYTSKIAGIGATFQKTDEEILAAANSLTKQLTGDFSKSLELIEKGFIAGADRGGDFLQQLKEYPTFFREAKLSGEQMIAVLSQSVQEGVFSDKGPDLIKEFNLRVREMPTATKAAFKAIGTSSKEIAATIDKEGIGGAFTLVQSKLKNLKEDSPEVGQALADIFGGPGEDAGVQFIKNLDLTEGAVDKLIDTSNDYTVALILQLEANEELAEAQNRVAKGFKETSKSLNIYITKTKAFLFRVAGDILEYFEDITAISAGQAAAFKKTGEIFSNVLLKIKIDAEIVSKAIEKLNPFGKTNAQLDEEIKKLKDKKTALSNSVSDIMDAYNEARRKGMEDIETRKKIAEALNPTLTAAEIKKNAEDLAKKQLEAKKKAIQAGFSKRRSLMEDLAKREVDAKEKALQEEFSKRRAASSTVDILGTQAPGQVSSTGEAAINTSDQDAILKNKFLKALITEQEYEDQRFVIAQEAYNRRLEFLREKFGEESQQFIELENTKLESQRDYESQRAELTKRTEEFRTQIQMDGVAALSDLVGATIELMQGEEGERKKNSVALKAFSIGKVLIDTQEAIMAIIKNAQANPANILFPGAGNIIAGLKIGAVTAKSVSSINKIRSQGFYERGHTGNNAIFRDNQGRGVVGAVHKDEWVAPKWQVEHPVFGQMIGWLENMRTNGFQEGGFAGKASIPIPTSATQAATGSSGNEMLERAIKEMTIAQKQMSEEIRRKTFSVPSGQVADALDEEYRLRTKSGF